MKAVFLLVLLIEAFASITGPSQTMVLSLPVPPTSATTLDK